MDRGKPQIEKGKHSFSFQDFFKLINRVHPKYWQLIVGILAGLIATGANLIVPQFAQRIINNFKHLNINLVIITGIVFFGGVIISALSGYILGVFGEHVVSKLRDNLWARLLKMPVSYFDNTSTGEISSRLVNDTSQVKNLLANTLPNAITSLLQFFGAVVIMFMMDWQMSLIMVLAVPLVIFVLLPFMRLSGKIGRARQDELAKFSSESTNVLSEIRLVKSSNSEKKELATGTKRIAKLYAIGVKESWINSLMQPISNMLMMILVIGILTYGAIRVMQGTLTMGALISFLMYLFQLMGPVIIISQFFNELAKTSGSTERIGEMLNEPIEVSADNQKVDIAGKELKLQNVSFSYEKGKQILHDINVSAKPNTVVAFAGQNIEEIDLTDWRKQIGLVGQNSSVMPGTIRENLVYGLGRKVSDDELWHVLKMAYADKFVKEAEDGLETQIGERGVKLSGGQRQRIAIARAFLRDPKILMLDEATASLDSESEAMVQKALASLMKNRMTLVIAHRLSTIVDADKIYFIDHGTVSGSGTHEELVKSTPLYAEYVHNQFKK